MYVIPKTAASDFMEAGPMKCDFLKFYMCVSKKINISINLNRSAIKLQDVSVDVTELLCSAL